MTSPTNSRLSNILFEDISSSSGSTVLYHYAKSDAPTLILDPKRFGASSFTKGDSAVTDVPRIFFYVDPQQRESIVEQQRNLYAVKVPTDSIYDLMADPEKIKDKFRMTSGRVDLDGLMRYVSGWDYGKKGFEKSSGFYKGLRYTAGGIIMVNWFDSIPVTKISHELRTSLETGKSSSVNDEDLTPSTINL